MMNLWGRRFDTGEPIKVQVAEGRITAVEPAWPDDDISAWPFLAPGLFDLQINGHGGIWFNQPGLTADAVRTALEPHWACGITGMFPTLVTNSFEALADGFRAIRQACEETPWVDQLVAGCHLEGPYISSADGPRGAHPLQHVRAPDWDEFQKLQTISGDRIRLLTLAPETDGAIDFIRRVSDSGVVVALGHTAAEPEQIVAAADAGARLSTHLGNGAHGQIRRHPNYIWAQLAEPRLMASLITDGHHLPVSVIRSFIATKSRVNSIITCDAAGLAGCPPGSYQAGEVAVEVLEDGRIVIAGQRQLLAGSSLTTDRCVALAVSQAGLTLAEAVEMAGRNPRRLLGLPEVSLQRGSPADLIQFDTHPDRLVVHRTLQAGKRRFAADIQPDRNFACGAETDRVAAGVQGDPA